MQINNSKIVSALRTKHGRAVGLLFLIVLLAGCTITYDTTISSDGEFDQLDIEIELGEENYAAVAQQAEDAEQDYHSVAEFVFSGEQGNLNIDESNWESVDLNDDGETTVGITATGGPQPQEMDDTAVTTTVDDDAGEVTYVDTDGIEDTSEGTTDAEINWEYVVRMPGEIIDTNGEVTDTGVVTWTSEDHGNLSEYRVLSEQTGAEQSTGDSDGLGPGFGIVAALAGLLSVVVLLVRKQTDN